MAPRPPASERHRRAGIARPSVIPDDVAAVAASAHREFAGKVLAVTLRSVRDLDVAQEATADAFLMAVQTWPERGVPASVEAWLIIAARNRAVDRIRRRQTAGRALPALIASMAADAPPADAVLDGPLIRDEELRLVVLCCDPRLPVADQVLLTLRWACGASTAAIAAAHLMSAATMAARLTRARKKLAAAGPDLDLPDDATVRQRIPAVCRAVHLAYTLGHTAAEGAELRIEDRAGRAVHLARTLHAQRPADPEITGLLGVVLLGEARAPGRLSGGRQVLLPDADRFSWDRLAAREGLAMAELSLAQSAEAGSVPGPLALQASISAEHVRAPSFAATDWSRIVDLYGLLLESEPSPTLAIARSVAVSYLRGPEAGLADLDEVLALGGLAGYPYAHAARAQLLDRLGRCGAAAECWRAAAEHARSAAERKFFAGRADASAEGTGSAAPGASRSTDR